MSPNTEETTSHLYSFRPKFMHIALDHSHWLMEKVHDATQHEEGAMEELYSVRSDIHNRRGCQFRTVPCASDLHAPWQFVRGSQSNSSYRS